MRRDPLEFLTEVAAYGPVAHFRIGSQEVFLLSDPDAIEDVLVTRAGQFAKGRALERAKRTLGEGLLTSEGAAHLRQRRLMQPAFHRGADRRLRRSRWREPRPQQLAGRRRAHDISKEMMRVTLSIVGETLFDTDVESKADQVASRRSPR